MAHSPSEIHSSPTQLRSSQANQCLLGDRDLIDLDWRTLGFCGTSERYGINSVWFAIESQ